MKDGDIEPDETKKGLVFFLLPKEPLESQWANIEVKGFLPQVITTKGYKVFVNLREKKQELDKAFMKGKQQHESRTYEPGYALLLGISNYKDYNYLPLPSSKKIVKDMENFLKDRGFEGVEPVINDSVTINDFTDPIRYFKGKIGKENSFLFYYSGHGETIKGEGYIPLSNAMKGELDHKIKMDEIMGWLLNMYTKRLLVLIDCCNSGWATDYPNGTTANAAQVLITAVTKDQNAIGSVFANAFMEGVRNNKKATSYKDPEYIYIDELWPYLRDQCEKNGNGMTPMLKFFGPTDNSGGFRLKRKGR